MLTKLKPKPKAEKILLTEKVGKKLRLSVKLDGNEYRVEKDEDDNKPVEHLWLDDVSHFEPSFTNTSRLPAECFHANRQQYEKVR